VHAGRPLPRQSPSNYPIVVATQVISPAPVQTGPKTVRVFAFLDLEHPAVAWAVMRGMVVSADQTYPPPHPGFTSFMLAGMIEWQNNTRIFNEAIIEEARLRQFQHQVSRLRGIFFFRSQTEAEARIGDPDWPPYFKRDNLIEFELSPVAPLTVVDANWITLAPLGPDFRLQMDDLDWIEKYWNGLQYQKEPVWEVIANGVAVILDEKVRRRSYDYVRQVFPKSHIPILMARLASEAGTLGGLTTPFLVRRDSENIELGYLWSDREFHDPEIIKKIAAHPDAGALGRMMRENETWNIPDFRPYGRTFKLGIQFSSDGVFPSVSVHHNWAA
jgi:hypothetical protein